MCKLFEGKDGLGGINCKCGGAISFKIFIYLSIGCAGSSSLQAGFLCRRVGASLVAVHKLLIEVASLLQSMGSRHMGFNSCSMRAQ